MKLDYAQQTTAIAAASARLAELCAQKKYEQVAELAAFIQNRAADLEIWAVKIMDE